MTFCNQCGKKTIKPEKSRHEFLICPKCKKTDIIEESKDESILMQLREFIKYLYKSDSINITTYNDLLGYESMYGTDGCDVNYILQMCAENCPKHLSEYFWEFEEICK